MLQSLPWDKVDIRTIAVETQFLDLDKKDRLFTLLRAAGFTHVAPLARYLLSSNMVAWFLVVW